MSITPPGENSARGLSLLRQSLAEQLHDGPLQELLALRLKAVNLARLGELSAEDRRERLAEIGSLAQSAVDHLCEVIHELAQRDPQPLQLYARVAELCDHFQASSGIECELALDPDHIRFVPELSRAVLRALRELLTNVRRHSHATAVRIWSHRSPDGAVAIAVQDNGQGMSGDRGRDDHNPFEAGGFGLWSIEQRLDAFDARLEIDSDSRGVRATVVVPADHLLSD